MSEDKNNTRAMNKTSIWIIILSCIIALATAAIVAIILNMNNKSQETIIENAEASNSEDLERLKEYSSQKTSEIINYQQNNTSSETINYINNFIDSTSKPDEKSELEIIKFDFYRITGLYDDAIAEIDTVETEKMNNEQKYRFYNIISGIYGDIGDREKAGEYYIKAMEYITSAIQQSGGSGE